jgi:hypothetical protein
VTDANARDAADGTLMNGGDPLIGKGQRVTADVTDKDENGRRKQPHQHPLTAVSRQSQSNANPETLSREFRKGTPGSDPKNPTLSEDDTAALTGIFNPVEGASRALSDDPSLAANSKAIQAQLDAVDQALATELEGEKQYSAKAKAALELAALIAKRIIRALTALELKDMWQSLHDELGKIQKDAAAAATAKKEAARLDAEQKKLARAARMAKAPENKGPQNRPKK